jgi:hypothetical protein
VFLSHTSELRDARQSRSFVARAEAAIRRAGHAVTHMAYFAASNAPPAKLCVDKLRQADVYVGLIGFRYGTPVPYRPDLSYTELEFETATELGIPRLIFLIDKETASDQSEEHRARQEAFRQRLEMASVTVARASTPAELEIEVFQALVELK